MKKWNYPVFFQKSYSEEPNQRLARVIFFSLHPACAGITLTIFVCGTNLQVVAGHRIDIGMTNNRDGGVRDTCCGIGTVAVGNSSGETAEEGWSRWKTGTI